MSLGLKFVIQWTKLFIKRYVLHDHGHIYKLYYSQNKKVGKAKYEIKLSVKKSMKEYFEDISLKLFKNRVSVDFI